MNYEEISYHIAQISKKMANGDDLSAKELLDVYLIAMKILSEGATPEGEEICIKCMKLTEKIFERLQVNARTLK